ERLDWTIQAQKPGPVQLEVTANTESPKPESMSYRILAIDRVAHYTRQQLCTDADGCWRLLEPPATLQDPNSASLTPIHHKQSCEIHHNSYGVAIHLPRARNYEDPFNPQHLIDANPETCWSSQQRPSPFPGNPPWIEISLPRPEVINQINLIPYWHNADFPVGFTVEVSENHKSWSQVLRVRRHVFNQNGPRRGDKIAQRFPLDHPAKARWVRLSFERLPLSIENYASVVQGYKAQLSGVEILNRANENLARLERGASIKASEYFTGWHDTPQTINKAFPKVMEIGLKWVRVGQWGDQTEWAAVEREKGKFALDPVTQKAIATLLKNRVGILYGLNYGNALYERPPAPGGGDLGPIYQEGHPFSFNGGPKTEAGREAFVRYVDYIVRKYQNRIQWYELWNEENGWYPGFNPEMYGKLLYAVGKHIKSIDPNIKLDALPIYMSIRGSAPTLATTRTSPVLRDKFVPNAKVALDVDSAKFFNLLIGRLSASAPA
ncbi:MAG: discoidin domain-containing protein, partial [Acidobacteriia bacterium]|nr:discoidin domain-containing protein [Terriglobia bacterium]